MQLKAIELAPSDHRAWGRLAESWRFIEGREEESQGAYESAIALAEPMLDINSQDWKTRGLLATYYVHTGRSEQAREMVEHALVISQNHPEALLYQALVMNALGDIEAARNALDLAVEKDKGYKLYIDQDPDFEFMQAVPESQ
jgi:tetratricopeptide (TPR) repeat protein